MKLAVISLCLLVLAGLLTSCETTGSRIKQHEKLFNSLDVEDQVAIKSKKVKVGFTQDMVYLALGKPNREYVRTTDQGVSTVWSYIENETRSKRQRVTDSFRVRDPGSGGYRTVKDRVWVTVDRHIEIEKKRIEFRDGKVFAIEEVIASNLLNF